MKVLNIVCIVLACINAACAVFNLTMAKWHNDEKKYYGAKLHELEEGEPETRFIINDDDLTTETCTCDYAVGNSDAQ